MSSDEDDSDDDARAADEFLRRVQRYPMVVLTKFEVQPISLIPTMSRF